MIGAAFTRLSWGWAVEGAKPHDNLSPYRRPAPVKNSQLRRLAETLNSGVFRLIWNLNQPPNARFQLKSPFPTDSQTSTGFHIPPANPQHSPQDSQKLGIL